MAYEENENILLVINAVALGFSTYGMTNIGS